MNLSVINKIAFRLDKEKGEHSPSISQVSSVADVSGKPWSQFEKTVLNFFVANKEELAIDKIYRLENVFIDSYLILKDGTGISVEFKSLLNWDKSCVGRSQLLVFNFGEFYKKIDLPRPEFGILIFESFTTQDWMRVQGGRKHQNGWYNFNKEQLFYNHLFKIYMLQLKEGQLWNPGF